MPVYGKIPSKVFSETSMPMTRTWYIIQYQCQGPTKLVHMMTILTERSTLFPKIYLNDDPEMNLTYFTARSNLLPNALVWGNAITRFCKKKKKKKKTTEVSGLKAGTNS